MKNRSSMTISGRLILVMMTVGLCLAGCSYPAERFHPQFPSYRRSMGAMLVLVPEIGIFEQLPDGSQLFHNIQSQEAQRQAQQSIVQQLQERHFTVQTVNLKMMQTPEFSDITSLFRSVNRSIQLHTFGPQPYPAKLTAFEYNLGPVADILKANKADGLVLALGHQTASDQPTHNWLSIAVVEPEGRIIWYGMHGDHQKYNLQTADGMTALVKTTLANFWEQCS